MQNNEAFKYVPALSASTGPKKAVPFWAALLKLYVTYRWAAYMPLNRKRCVVISRVRKAGLLVCG